LAGVPDAAPHRPLPRPPRPAACSDGRGAAQGARLRALAGGGGGGGLRLRAGGVDRRGPPADRGPGRRARRGLRRFSGPRRRALVLRRVGADALRDRHRQLRGVERPARRRARREPGAGEPRPDRRGLRPRRDAGLRGRVSSDPYVLPEGLPVPEDHGPCDHLPGLELPHLRLESSHGTVDVHDFEVLYVYPQAGRPGRPLLPGWDAIPGARGCTPQSCGFRDHAAELAELGARVAGLSAQSIEDQVEFAERNHIPYPVVSDEWLELERWLGLPTFDVEGLTLYKRMALVVEQRRIVKVFYPVFPPDRNAEEVVAWLAS